MSDGIKIALLGAGQIGGSFAMALRAAGTEAFITAYDTDPRHAEYLRQQGAVDAIATSPAEAVKGAELVVFATPLRSYRALAEAIAPALESHAAITDMGSVKKSMMALADILPAKRMVPGHPIAGSEKVGPEAARADLFKGRLCILTPNDAADETAVRLVETLWFAAGAEVLSMPTEVHDAVYAHVSHLPHFIAFACAEYFSALGATIGRSDEILQQFLRISRSDARMWTDIALENREAFLPALSTYTAVLDHIAGELRGGEIKDGERMPLAKELLPRILGSTLISAVSLYEQQSGMSAAPFGGAGLRDIIAPVMSTPEPDIEAISDKASLIADMVDAIVVSLKQLESLIGAEDEPGLFAALSNMSAHARELVTPRQ